MTTKVLIRSQETDTTRDTDVGRGCDLDLLNVQKVYNRNNREGPSEVAVGSILNPLRDERDESKGVRES